MYRIKRTELLPPTSPLTKRVKVIVFDDPGGEDETVVIQVPNAGGSSPAAYISAINTAKPGWTPHDWTP